MPTESSGGFFIIRPEPIQITRGATIGIKLLSDFHIGATNVDYKRIIKDLKEAEREGDRILINGDVFDFILPSDSKRFSPDALHPRLRGRRDILNSCLDWGVEVLSPYADLIDMIGIGNHECFDRETEILTDSGWKFFHDLQEADEVASFKAVNSEIEFAKPLARQSYDYNGDLITIKGNNTDLAITPNHKIIYKDNAVDTRNHRVGQGTIIQTKYSTFIASICKNGKFKYGTSRKTKLEADADRELFSKNSGIKYMDGGWIMRQVSDLPSKQMTIPCTGRILNSDYNIQDDEIRVVAWVLTDGWIGNTRDVAICQRESKAHIIDEILNRLECDFRRTVRDRDIKEICGKILKKKPEASVEFNLRGSSRKRILELIDHKNGDIPKWVRMLSKRQFDIFLSSIIDGDGSRHIKNPDTSLMVYGKEVFLSNLQSLCAMFEYRTSLTEYRAGAWRLNITPYNTTTIYRNKFGREHYSGKVYCVTTHNDTVVVRRHGKVSITGNSSVEKHHHVDLVLMLCDKLGAVANRTINYGGYTGFVDYRFRRGSSDTRRLVIYYHHGTGGAAPATKGMTGLNRKSTWVDSDVIWEGHKHNKLADTTPLRLRCPISGDDPLEEQQVAIMSGAYMKNYVGQTQEDVRSRGRRSPYSADWGMPPQAMGGARLIVNFPNSGGKEIKILQ